MNAKYIFWRCSVLLYFSINICSAKKAAAIAAKSIKMLIRFQPLIEGLMRVAKSDPRPPVVPNRKRVKPIKLNKPSLESVLLPAIAQTRVEQNTISPSTPMRPRDEVIFSLMSGVEALY